MTFVSHHSIDKAWITDFRNECLQPASYDLRLGADVYVVGDIAPVRLTKDEPYLVLKPGQFAMLTTFEQVNMPADYLGFITIRMRYKNQGLVNISGFHVDPTFSGQLKFAVQNVGPSDIHLKFSEPTFSIFFARLETKSNKRRPAAGPAISIEDVHLLGGSNVTLSELKRDIERLRQQMLIYAPFAVSAFIALLVLIFKIV
jgi:dCTP deaminase